MSETAPKTELMRSLGRLVRACPRCFGIAHRTGRLLAKSEHQLAGLARPFSLIAPVAVTSLLLYGLWLMGDFQKQERIWLLALDRAKVLAW